MNKLTVLLCVSVILGVAGWYLDDRILATNDDGAIFTLSYMLLAGLVLGAAGPERPWLSAVVMTGCMCIVGIAFGAFMASGHGNSSVSGRLALFAITSIAALVGAYAGVLVRMGIVALLPKPS